MGASCLPHWIIFYLISPLTIIMATVRPPKRRKAGHRLPPMIEGSDASFDTAMYIRSDRGEQILVPIWPDIPVTANTCSESGTVPELVPDFPLGPDIDMSSETHDPPRKNSCYYMKEFVARVDEILQAMQAREALSDSAVCAECSGSHPHWRCDDCIGGKLLCRFCMRHSHFSNPFHRIECWTGTHFRKAALWEVGVYLMLPHQNAPSVCPNLSSQQNMLERLQKRKDGVIRQGSLAMPNIPDYDEKGDSVHDTEMEASEDDVAMRFLDQLLAGHTPDDILEDEDAHAPLNTEADLHDMDAGTAGFTNYMNECPDPELAIPSLDSTPGAPSCDALSNQYIRVVHTNGIHHIALVSCSCRGHENITTDLIYAGWVPTSFTRVRTIFTAAVLDHFRYCNLEMRSSAYQFFQLLRRVTNTLSPSKVVNLYHELRRLSRLWRWVKKLKWAGYAQQAGQEINPKPGELGNFCPACPQVGVNLPESWKDDPNRWVFRRVITADGNFKADHVRQKSPADDIWLSDGLGMTARNSEYQTFLKTAQERKTVSVNKKWSFRFGSCA